MKTNEPVDLDNTKPISYFDGMENDGAAAEMREARADAAAALEKQKLAAATPKADPTMGGLAGTSGRTGTEARQGGAALALTPNLTKEQEAALPRPTPAPTKFQQMQADLEARSKKYAEELRAKTGDLKSSDSTLLANAAMQSRAKWEAARAAANNPQTEAQAGMPTAQGADATAKAAAPKAPAYDYTNKAVEANRAAAEQKRRNRAKYDAAVGDQFAAALDGLANNMKLAQSGGEGAAGVVRETADGRRYVTGMVDKGVLEGAGNNLSKLGGRDAISSVIAYQQVDKYGNPIGEPQFALTYDKNGNVGKSEGKVLKRYSMGDAARIMRNAQTAMGMRETEANAYVVNALRGANPYKWETMTAEEAALKKAQAAANAKAAAATAKGETSPKFDKAYVEALGNYINSLEYEKKYVEGEDGQVTEQIVRRENLSETEKANLAAAKEQQRAYLMRDWLNNGGMGKDGGGTNGGDAGVGNPAPTQPVLPKNWNGATVTPYGTIAYDGGAGGAQTGNGGAGNAAATVTAPKAAQPTGVTGAFNAMLTGADGKPKAVTMTAEDAKKMREEAAKDKAENKPTATPMATPTANTPAPAPTASADNSEPETDGESWANIDMSEVPQIEKPLAYAKKGLAALGNAVKGGIDAAAKNGAGGNLEAKYAAEEALKRREGMTDKEIAAEDAAQRKAELAKRGLRERTPEVQAKLDAQVRKDNESYLKERAAERDAERTRGNNNALLDAVMAKWERDAKDKENQARREETIERLTALENERREIRRNKREASEKRAAALREEQLARNLRKLYESGNIEEIRKRIARDSTLAALIEEVTGEQG